MNAAMCKACGDLLRSNSVHEFKTCYCRLITVDGGLEYKQRGGNPELIYEIEDEDEYNKILRMTLSERIMIAYIHLNNFKNALNLLQYIEEIRLMRGII